MTGGVKSMEYQETEHSTALSVYPINKKKRRCMKLTLETTKEFKGWAFRFHDDSTEPGVIETTVYLLPTQLKRIDEIVTELRSL